MWEDNEWKQPWERARKTEDYGLVQNVRGKAWAAVKRTSRKGFLRTADKLLRETQ